MESFATAPAISGILRGNFNRLVRFGRTQGDQADINLSGRTLTIRKSKTVAGERVIPLTQEAHNVLIQLRARAELFGQVEPAHFVFAAFRATGRFDGNEMLEMHITSFDPTHPVGGWRTA
jgi:hypothetical protein